MNFLKQLREDIEDAKSHKLLVEITNDDILWLIDNLEKAVCNIEHPGGCDLMCGTGPCDCPVSNFEFILSQGPPNEPKKLNDGKETK